MTVKHFNLPDPGEGLVEAEVVTWRVKVGDTVQINDIIVEIETAKSLVELPVPYAGTVTALLAAEGDTVAVGTPIISVDDGFGGDVAPAPTSSTKTSSTKTSPAGTSPADTAEAGMSAAGIPKAGTLEAATSQGEAASVGGAAGSGRVANLVGYGPRVTGTKRRARHPAGAPASAGSSAAVPAVQTPAPEPAVARPLVGDLFGGQPGSVSRGDGARALAKPPVRKLAKDLGIDLSQVAGSGEGGIVTRADVQLHAATNEAAGAAIGAAGGAAADDATLVAAAGAGSPAYLLPEFAGTGERETRVPVKGVRKLTAQAMVASAFTAPHVTEFVTVDVTRTIKLVDRLKADREFRDVKVSPLLIVAKALIIACGRNPGINATWDEVAQEIVVKHYVNLGIAAATPRGLMVPNIKDADRMSLRQLADAMAHLVSTARDGRTPPAAMAGGSITITNVGVFGVDTGTPILNSGEAAILCFGAVRRMPWVVKGKIKARWVTQLGLSFDHRMVDGDLGSLFLADIAALLHDPSKAIAWT